MNTFYKSTGTEEVFKTQSFLPVKTTYPIQPNGNYVTTKALPTDIWELEKDREDNSGRQEDSIVSKS